MLGDSASTLAPAYVGSPGSRVPHLMTIPAAEERAQCTIRKNDLAVRILLPKIGKHFSRNSLECRALRG
jgi:hypothetical protein